MNVLIILAYKTLGKFGTLALFEIVGTLLVIVGLKDIAAGKE